MRSRLLPGRLRRSRLSSSRTSRTVSMRSSWTRALLARVSGSAQRFAPPALPALEPLL